MVLKCCMYLCKIIQSLSLFNTLSYLKERMLAYIYDAWCGILQRLPLEQAIYMYCLSYFFTSALSS